jgi:hypothetical protein
MSISLPNEINLQPLFFLNTFSRKTFKYFATYLIQSSRFHLTNPQPSQHTAFFGKGEDKYTSTVC